MVVTRDDAGACLILSRELGIELSTPAYGFILRDSNAATVGAFAFNNYSGPNIELTIAVRQRLTLGAVREIARLAFVVAGARRITVHTKASNKRAQRACQTLGFRYEGRAADFYEDDDAEVYALLAREQKLIRIAR